MKTVVIFDECEANLRFFVLEGDFGHLNGVYINSCGPEGLSKKEQKELVKKQNELNGLIYDEESGQMKVPTFHLFPTQAVIDGAQVIVAGFVP